MAFESILNIFQEWGLFVFSFFTLMAFFFSRKNGRQTPTEDDFTNLSNLDNKF